MTRKDPIREDMICGSNSNREDLSLVIPKDLLRVTKNDALELRLPMNLPRFQTSSCPASIRTASSLGSDPHLDMPTSPESDMDLGPGY